MAAAAEPADVVAAAVRGVPGVAGLHAGMFGETGTYCPAAGSRSGAPGRRRRRGHSCVDRGGAERTGTTSTGLLEALAARCCLSGAEKQPVWDRDDAAEGRDPVGVTLTAQSLSWKAGSP